MTRSEFIAAMVSTVGVSPTIAEAHAQLQEKLGCASWNRAMSVVVDQTMPPSTWRLGRPNLGLS